MQATRRDFALLAVGLALLFTFLLGGRGLNEPDEGRYANIALGFSEPGAKWWEPRMSGFAHYDKPPLTYWLTAISFKVLGSTELAARIPSLLGACLALVGLGWAAWRLYGREVAWWAVFICGTLGQFWFLARFLSPDMLLTGFCTLAVGAWAEARRRQGHWGFWALGVLSWTLAWWVKGTPALIPLCGLTVGVLIRGDRLGNKALKAPLLVLSILLLGSPWFIWLMVRYPELTDFFFGRELVGRAIGHPDGRKGPIYYHLLLVFVAWLPWLAVLFAAGLANRRILHKWDWPTLRQAVGIEGWIVATGLGIFSLISSKLPTYTLPLAPWAALFLARLLLKLREILSPSAFRKFTLWPAASVLLLYLGAAILAPRFESGLMLNSSLKPICAELERREARLVLTDRYWPGIEFYFGHRVCYVVDFVPRQRRDDDGVCPAIGSIHFCPVSEWQRKADQLAQTNVWLVHYVRNKRSPFKAWLEQNRGGERLAQGDFMLARLK